MREQIAVAVDEIGGPEQNAGTLGGCHLRPRTGIEGLARTGSRSVSVGRRTTRRSCDECAMGRAVPVECCAAPALDILAIDPHGAIARKAGQRGLQGPVIEQDGS